MVRWGGLLLGVVLLLIAFSRLRWKEILVALASVHPAYLILSAGVAAIAVVCRSMRLAILLGAEERFSCAWRAYALGYLGGLVLPLGSGELVKIAALSRLSGFSWTRCGAATLLDRLMDFSGMMGVLALVLAVEGAGGLRLGPISIFLGIMVLLLAGTMLILLWGEQARRHLLRLQAWRGEGWAGSLLKRYDQVHAQALMLRSTRRIVRVVVLQISILLLDTLGTWSSLHAFSFGAGMDFMVPLRINLYLMFAAALPVLPGGIGTYQVACILALRSLSVPTAGVWAFSIAAQATSLAFITVQGLVALVHAPRHLFDLRSIETQRE